MVPGMQIPEGGESQVDLATLAEIWSRVYDYFLFCHQKKPGMTPVVVQKRPPHGAGI